MALTERPAAPSADAKRHSSPIAVVDAEEATRLVRRAAFLVGLIWLPIIVIWSGIPFALTFDDSYYYAEIARNLAHGAGSTFDRIDTTNGYHPLWLGLSVPVFVLGVDGTAAIRVLLVAQLAMWVTTLWIVAGIVGRRLGGAPRAVVLTVTGVLVVAGGNPFVLKMVVNGLESAPVVLISVLLLDRVDRSEGRMLGGTDLTRLLSGALLSLAFLARTDAILLLACVGAWTMIEARGHDAATRKALAQVLVLPALTVLAYSAINLAWFGHVSQVSGEVKRASLTLGRLGALVVVGACAVTLMAWLSRKRPDGRPSRLARLAAFTANTAWYPAFLVLLVGYYTILSTQLWLWYFAPIGLYAMAMLVLVAADLLDGARLEAPDQSLWRAMAPVAVILALPLVAALVLQSRSFADPEARSIQEANREAGAWITDNLAADAVVGSWDAGVVGYFADQPVINLDGVVNSFDYVDASRAGTQGAFLRERGMAYLANHGPLVDGEDPEIVDATTDLLGADAAAGLEQVHRVDFTYSGTTTGGAGYDSTDHMAVFVYELPN